MRESHLSLSSFIKTALFLCRMLATEVVENFLRLRDRLNQLIQQLAEGNSIANSTNVLLNEASEFLDTSESLLDGSRVRLREARSSLSEVDTRLGELESRIEQNERDLETARNLTSLAEEAADEVERVMNGREGAAP